MMLALAPMRRPLNVIALVAVIGGLPLTRNTAFRVTVSGFPERRAAIPACVKLIVVEPRALGPPDDCALTTSGELVTSTPSKESPRGGGSGGGGGGPRRGSQNSPLFN